MTWYQIIVLVLGTVFVLGTLMILGELLGALLAISQALTQLTNKLESDSVKVALESPVLLDDPLKVEIETTSPLDVQIGTGILPRDVMVENTALDVRVLPPSEERATERSMS